MRQRTVRGRGLLAVASAPLALLLLCVPLAIVAESVALLWHTPSDGLGGVAVALSLSLRSATVATAGGVLFGTPLALFIVRRSSRAMRTSLTVLTTLPLVLPPAAAGLGLLLALGPSSIAGGLADALGTRIAFTGAAVIIAQLFVSSPLYLAQAIRAFERAEADLADIATIDGASDARYLTRVLVPATFPQLLIGVITMWARAIGEFGATMIFAGNLPGRTRTLPLELYVGLQSGLGTALASATTLLAVAAIVIAAVSLLQAPVRPRRA